MPEDLSKLSVDEVFRKLESSRNGLSEEAFHRRIKNYGYNEIPEEKISPVVTFLSYFWGPIPWMIEIAIILAAVIQHWEDVYIIGALLLLNAGVGFWQERKAGNAIELLKKKLALKARVLRDGKWLEIAARELVPGDVIHLRLGDIIPADIKLISGEYLSLDESALTGESLPVEKQVSDVAYSGSIIQQGEMNAVVTTTGLNTFFGKTARLVEKAETPSHLQQTIIKIGDYLIVLAMVMVAIIFVSSLFRHESFLETIQFILVLVVASIPVALPAVLSVTMAVGATVLAKKEAIVSKLVSIEEMAGMDVLCADKTGTITKNKMTLAKIKPFSPFTEEDVLLYAFLASQEESKDPIDDAILVKAHGKLGDLTSKYRITKFKPFDPVSKRTEAFIENSYGFKVSKGATQVILSLTDIGIHKEMEEYVDRFARKGYRSLGIAKTDRQQKWHYVGLIALYDPPREDSAITIEKAQSMGVAVKMVTGDHVAIAKEISEEVNLGKNISIPSSFLDKPDREVKSIIEDADGFAQVFPEHKYNIVKLLQNSGHIVGMTGDGVNDAPALKKADAGIAVVNSTDAAKSAADIVITRPGLSVIIDAIKESRKIFQRMNNYSIYRIAETIRVLFFISFSIIIFNFYPVTALMIVLLALLNDAPIMTIAYDHVIYSDKPEKWNLHNILAIATMLGLVGVLTSFLILYIGIDEFHLSREVLQSFIYLKLSVSGHLMVFIARTKGHFWSIKPSMPLFLAVIITQFIATLITVYGFLLPAMGWNLAIFVWIYCLIVFVIVDFLKVRFYKWLDQGKLIF
jgi:H+-transporting ATPase